MLPRTTSMPSLQDADCALETYKRRALRSDYHRFRKEERRRNHANKIAAFDTLYAFDDACVAIPRDTSTHVSVLRSMMLKFMAGMEVLVVAALTPCEYDAVERGLVRGLSHLSGLRRRNRVMYTDIDLLLYSIRLIETQQSLANRTQLRLAHDKHRFDGLLSRARHLAAYAPPQAAQARRE
jgi:hypothetical protein